MSDSHGIPVRFPEGVRVIEGERYELPLDAAGVIGDKVAIWLPKPLEGWLYAQERSGAWLAYPETEHPNA